MGLVYSILPNHRSHTPTPLRSPLYLFCFFCLTLAFLISCPLSSMARKEPQGIAAVVNKSILTHKDIEDRLHLIQISSSQKTFTPEQLESMRAIILKNMIDELLQIEEATLRGVTIDEAEVIQAINNIEASNGMPPGKLPLFLKENGVPFSTLKDQIYANLLWARYIAEGYGDSAAILDHELEEVYEKILSQGSVSAVHAHEIVLPFENDSQKEAAIHQANKIAASLRKGASFPTLAKEFSKSASAQKGGDLGWVNPGQFEEPLNTALFRLGIKKVSEPLMTSNAVYLFWITDKKADQATPEMLFDLAQVGISLFLDRSPEALDDARARLETLRSHIKSCSTLDALAEKAGASVIFTQNVLVSHLPPDLKELVIHLNENQSSSIFTTDNGPSFVVLCKKHEYKDAPSGPPTKDMLREGMRNQKLDLISRRVLKDLRRRAFIDVRS